MANSGIINFLKSVETRIEGNENEIVGVNDTWYVISGEYGTFLLSIIFDDALDSSFNTLSKMFNNNDNNQVIAVRHYVYQYQYAMKTGYIASTTLLGAITPCIVEYIDNIDIVSFKDLIGLLEYNGIENAVSKFQRNIYQMITMSAKTPIQDDGNLMDFPFHIQSLISKLKFRISLVKLPDTQISIPNDILSLDFTTISRLLFHYAVTFYALYLYGINLNTASIHSASFYEVFTRPKHVIYLINDKPYYVDTHLIPIIDSFWYSCCDKIGKNLILTNTSCKEGALCNTVLNNKDFVTLVFNLYHQIDNERIRDMLKFSIMNNDVNILAHALEYYDGEVIKLFNPQTGGMEVITTEQYGLFNPMEDIIEILYNFYLNHDMITRTQTHKLQEKVANGEAELYIIDRRVFSGIYKNGINENFINNTIQKWNIRVVDLLSNEDINDYLNEATVEVIDTPLPVNNVESPEIIIRTSPSQEDGRGISSPNNRRVQEHPPHFDFFRFNNMHVSNNFNHNFNHRRNNYDTSDSELSELLHDEDEEHVSATPSPSFDNNVYSDDDEEELSPIIALHDDSIEDLRTPPRIIRDIGNLPQIIPESPPPRIRRNSDDESL
jgi:hypothetical protein